MSKSIFYILTNAAMPGYVKVGITDNLQSRMSTLDNTSIPVPFQCYYAAEVDDARLLERGLLDGFGDHRVRSNREWLTIDPARIIAVLKLIPHTEITPDEQATDQATKEDIETAVRRSASSFETLNIPEGAILTFTRDPSITCSAQQKNNVLLEGETLSVSAAALKVLHKLGRNWSTVNGYQFWQYEEETLSERRNRLEEERSA